MLSAKVLIGSPCIDYSSKNKTKVISRGQDHTTNAQKNKYIVAVGVPCGLVVTTRLL